MPWYSRYDFLAYLASATVDRCVPRYAPDEWSSEQVLTNRCYNYACNIPFVGGAFAIPGAARGIELGTSYGCDEVRDAAIADGLVFLGLSYPERNGSGGCGGGCRDCYHVVALAIRPPGLPNPNNPEEPRASDYHWYRRDRGGYWSHKAGPMVPTNLDDSRRLITDPKTANRGDYSIFCGHFAVDRNRSVTIGARIPGPAGGWQIGS